MFRQKSFKGIVHKFLLDKAVTEDYASDNAVIGALIAKGVKTIGFTNQDSIIRQYEARTSAYLQHHLRRISAPDILLRQQTLKKLQSLKSSKHKLGSSQKQQLQQQQQEDELKKKEEETEQPDRDLKELTSRRDEITRRIEALRKNRVGVNANIDQLKRKMDLLERDLKTLQTKQKSTAGEESGPERKNFTNQHKIDGLKRDRDTVVRNIFALRKKRTSLEHGLLGLRKEQDAIDSEIEDLQEPDVVECSIGKAKEVVMDHEIDVSRWKTSTVDDVEDLEKKCEALDHAIGLLEKREVMGSDAGLQTKGEPMLTVVDNLRQKRNSLKSDIDVLKKVDGVQGSDVIGGGDSDQRRKSIASDEGVLPQTRDSTGDIAIQKNLSTMEEDENSSDHEEVGKNDYQQPVEAGREDYKLSPLELSLLNRTPIIAQDGYVPNSIIRQKIMWKPPVQIPSTEVKRWEPLPVPDVSPEGSHESVWFLEDEEEPMKTWVECFDTSMGENMGENVPEEEPPSEIPMQKTVSSVKRQIKEQMKDEWDLEQMYKQNIAGWRKEGFNKQKKKEKAKRTMSLLRRVCAQSWFPESTDAAVANHLSLQELMTLLLSDDPGQNIWDSIIRINKVKGIVQKAKNKFLHVLRRKLKKPDVKKKIRALKTIQSLVDPDQYEQADELVADILPSVTHRNRKLSRVAVNTICKVKNFSTKDQLMDLLQRNNIVKKETHKENEESALKIMEEKIRMRDLERSCLIDKEKETLIEEHRVHLSVEETLRLSEKEKLRLGEEGKLHLSEKEKLILSEEKRLRLSEQTKLSLNEEEKSRLSKEDRLHLSEEEKLRLSKKEKLHLSEEEKLHLSKKEKLHLSEEEKLHLSKKEKLHLSEEEKLCLSEEERLRLSEEEKLHLSEEKLRMIEEWLRLCEEEKLHLSEEEKLRLSEEWLHLSEEEKLQIGLRMIEAERLHMSDEERLRLNEVWLHLSEEWLRLSVEQRSQLSEEERLRLSKGERLRLSEKEKLRLSKGERLQFSEEERLKRRLHMREEEQLHLSEEERQDLKKDSLLRVTFNEWIDKVRKYSQDLSGRKSLQLKAKTEKEELCEGTLRIAPIIPQDSMRSSSSPMVMTTADEERLKTRPVAGVKESQQTSSVSSLKAKSSASLSAESVAIMRRSRAKKMEDIAKTESLVGKQSEGLSTAKLNKYSNVSRTEMGEASRTTLGSSSMVYSKTDMADSDSSVRMPIDIDSQDIGARDTSAVATSSKDIGIHMTSAVDIGARVTSPVDISSEDNGTRMTSAVNISARVTPAFNISFEDINTRDPSAIDTSAVDTGRAAANLAARLGRINRSNLSSSSAAEMAHRLEKQLAEGVPPTAIMDLAAGLLGIVSADIVAGCTTKSVKNLAEQLVGNLESSQLWNTGNEEDIGTRMTSAVGENQYDAGRMAADLAARLGRLNRSGLSSSSAAEIAHRLEKQLAEGVPPTAIMDLAAGLLGIVSADIVAGCTTASVENLAEQLADNLESSQLWNTPTEEGTIPLVAVTVPENWREFLRTPSALERKRFYKILTDFVEGRITSAQSFPSFPAGKSCEPYSEQNDLWQVESHPSKSKAYRSLQKLSPEFRSSPDLSFVVRSQELTGLRSKASEEWQSLMALATVQSHQKVPQGRSSTSAERHSLIDLPLVMRGQESAQGRSFTSAERHSSMDQPLVMRGQEGSQGRSFTSAERHSSIDQPLVMRGQEGSQGRSFTSAERHSSMDQPLVMRGQEGSQGRSFTSAERHSSIDQPLVMRGHESSQGRSFTSAERHSSIDQPLVMREQEGSQGRSFTSAERHSSIDQPLVMRGQEFAQGRSFTDAERHSSMDQPLVMRGQEGAQGRSFTSAERHSSMDQPLVMRGQEFSQGRSFTDAEHHSSMDQPLVMRGQEGAQGRSFTSAERHSSMDQPLVMRGQESAQGRSFTSAERHSSMDQPLVMRGQELPQGRSYTSAEHYNPMDQPLVMRGQEFSQGRSFTSAERLSSMDQPLLMRGQERPQGRSSTSAERHSSMDQPLVMRGQEFSQGRSFTSAERHSSMDQPLVKRGQEFSQQKTSLDHHLTDLNLILSRKFRRRSSEMIYKESMKDQTRRPSAGLKPSLDLSSLQRARKLEGAQIGSMKGAEDFGKQSSDGDDDAEFWRRFLSSPRETEADSLQKTRKIRSLRTLVESRLSRVKQGGSLFKWKLPHPPPPKSITQSDRVVPLVKKGHHHFYEHTHLSAEKCHQYVSNCADQTEVLKIVETSEYHRYAHYFSTSRPGEEKKAKAKPYPKLELKHIVQELFMRS
ncbi:uncharacterized protein LOC121387649 isoform X5 [Gigantopelta aegis]|uniref:uncharacterized protein LOC121387649 isoform X5 n=1 Tax=Gigantopelta aegis TaxID=1735272 RepID=UPI001B88C043|nr:uncharacterized protein LOC121387649 isoform X5 [Gigantopelta aegis]